MNETNSDQINIESTREPRLTEAITFAIFYTSNKIL